MADDLIKPAQFARLVKKDRSFISRLMTAGYLSFETSDKGRKMINPVKGQEELDAYLNNSPKGTHSPVTHTQPGTRTVPAQDFPPESVPGSFHGVAKSKGEIELQIREVELEQKMIALAKEKGLLVTKEFHDRENGELITQFLMKLDQLPGRVSEQLVDAIISMIKAGEPNDQIIKKAEDIIGEECDKAKEEISDA